MGPYNEGPLWIWTYMKYTTDNSTGTVTVQSPMMRTPTNYIIRSARGFHYCKVLSPFRVMEWIYTDSLFSNDGIKNDYSNEEVVEDFFDTVQSGIDLVSKIGEDIFLN